MNPHSRLKRVTPERSGPNRNPLVGAGAGAAAAPGSIPNAALRGALECSVQTAYAVIDEYMRRGYEAARDNQHPQNGGDHMNNDRSNYGSPYSNPFNASGPGAPVIEWWSAVMRAWTDACSAFMPGGRQTAWPWPAGTGYSTSAPSPAVSVEVSSTRPTEVIVNLRPGTCPAELVADCFVPPLYGVSIQRKEGRFQVRVAIANDHPAGTFKGVIRGTDGTVAGDVTVVITQLAKGPA